MAPHMMAFWRYHDGNVSYYLCGTVVRMREDGFVETKEYGAGHWFRPVKIVPLAAGLTLKSTIEAALSEYKARGAALKAEFDARIARLGIERI